VCGCSGGPPPHSWAKADLAPDTLLSDDLTALSIPILSGPKPGRAPRTPTPRSSRSTARQGRMECSWPRLQSNGFRSRRSSSRPAIPGSTIRACRISSHRSAASAGSSRSWRSDRVRSRVARCVRRRDHLLRARVSVSLKTEPLPCATRSRGNPRHGRRSCRTKP